jgi:hypothetical protein
MKHTSLYGRDDNEQIDALTIVESALAAACKIP